MPTCKFGQKSNTFGFWIAHINEQNAEGFCTVLYYTNPESRLDWAGETLFSDQQRKDIIKAIYPKPGRIAFLTAAFQPRQERLRASVTSSAIPSP